MKKRILAIFLVIVMLVTMLPAYTISSFALTSGDFEYVVISEENKTCEITGYTGSATKVKIPSEIDSYTVTRIVNYAFRDCTSLTSITIPDSVTHIGYGAFYNCTSLTSITIPDSVISIGDSAFDNCTSLTSITIPDSVTTIGGDAFHNTGYYNEESNWDNDVLYIGNHLIGADIYINSCNIKQGTKTIAGGAFDYCFLLTNITIPDSVTIIGGSAFRDCSSLTNLTIPDSVTEIGGSVFDGCSSLTSITIPDGVTIIGSSAFRDCSSLTNLTIPDSVTHIYEGAFYGCTSLTSITIPDTVTTIGSSAFRDCSSLTSITIPDSVTEIGDSVFVGCSSLASVTIPDSVTTIGDSAFSMCSSLESLYYTGTIDDWIKILFASSSSNPMLYAENEYFNGELVNDVVLSDSTTEIGDYVFSGSNMTSVAIPNSVKTIGAWAFYNCTSLTSITIPDSVTYIDEGAFECCSSVTRVTIPDGVSRIEDSTFADCSSLTNITIPDGVISIGYNAFRGCSSLTSITIPDNVMRIYGWAFEDCSSLTSITIPDGVTSVSVYAFADCISLTSITIPDSVTHIYEGAFYGCTSLTSITIPDSVFYIARSVFNYCASLTSITIPNSVKYIGERAFYDCENLTDVYYLGTEEEWNNISIDNTENYNDVLFNATLYYNYGKFTGIKDNHIYINDVMQKAYQLVEVDSDFYYIADRHEIVKDKKVYIKAERTNGLTFDDGSPINAGYYEFDEDGKMVLLDGIVGNKIYKNNVQLKAYQLVEVDGEFYYIADRHEIVKDKKVYIKAERTNGLTFDDGSPITAGYYEFDADGKMVLLDGIVGNKIYKNNVQLKAYQLVEVGGDFYYIADRHEIVKDKKVYIKAERTNGLTFSDGSPITAGYYEFDADGKMVILNGIVGNEIYKNGVQLKAYQLVEVDGDYYYIGDRHEIVKNKTVYVKADRINGLTYADGTPITAGWYSFDADGKMIIE